jgi:hypothetical protein
MALQTTVNNKDAFIKTQVSFLSQLKKEHLIAGVAGGAVSCFAVSYLDRVV